MKDFRDFLTLFDILSFNSIVTPFLLMNYFYTKQYLIKII